MSTSLPASGLISSRVAIGASSVAPAGRVAGGQLGAVVAPDGLLVHGLVRDRPQPADHRAVEAALERRRHAATRRLVHERHELVGEAGHRAADADPADVRAAADAGHPPALGDVAVDDRPPAADLHLALRRVVVLREVALLVVARAVTALVDRLA